MQMLITHMVHWLFFMKVHILNSLLSIGSVFEEKSIANCCKLIERLL